MCIITSACMWVPIFNLLSIGRQHSHILCNNPTSTKSGVSLHVYISHPYSNLNNHQPSPEFTDIILISSLKSPSTCLCPFPGFACLFYYCCLYPSLYQSHVVAWNPLFPFLVTCLSSKPAQSPTEWAWRRVSFLLAF